MIVVVTSHRVGNHKNAYTVKNVVYRNTPGEQYFTVSMVTHTVTSEHPRGAIFYCFHGNPYCYHGSSKILLPWGVQLHRVFYSVFVTILLQAAFVALQPFGLS